MRPLFGIGMFRVGSEAKTEHAPAPPPQIIRELKVIHLPAPMPPISWGQDDSISAQEMKDYFKVKEDCGKPGVSAEGWKAMKRKLRPKKSK